MLHTSETATIEVMTGMKVSVRNTPMPGTCRLKSTASRSASTTPAGTVSTQYQSVLSSAVMNWSS